MGLLQDGKWVDKWYDTDASDGEFVRQASGFRNWVTADGAAGPTGQLYRCNGSRTPCCTKTRPKNRTVHSASYICNGHTAQPGNPTSDAVVDFN